MALNSTSRRRYGALLAAAATGAVAAIIGLASPASAHTPKASAGCDEATETTTLEVKLTAYNKQKPNYIKVTNGDEVVLEKTEFGESFTETWTFPGNVDYQFVVDVKAWDGERFDYFEKFPVKACVTETTPPEEPPTTTTTPEVPPTTPPTETTTTTTTTSETPPPSDETTTTQPTPSDVANEEELAETGASIALPLGIAGVLLVGGLVLLFVVRRRSRA